MLKRTTWRKGLDRCFLDEEFAPDYESIQVDEWDLSAMVKGPTFLSLTASGQLSETLLTKAITGPKSRGTSFDTTLSHHVQRYCFLSISLYMCRFPTENCSSYNICCEKYPQCMC